ncbi:McKusick-Kaufman/Bardet-Biedl syndromes putative chaperonin isoform X2 [Nilaparvata lugens]|nr:McKusick-Kaufman/Bardet-Biedl syndromes putative chaperonin isoform X2 [Nilaparvata lugens]XP_022200486.2 McKusick-Kaufman/Bardet-Biedl syndromes putative chaperonin isoform X2 [Nilaparvata lugens]
MQNQNERKIIELSDVHFINELREFKKMISSLIGAHGNLNVFVTGGGYIQLGSSSAQLTNFFDQFNNPLIQLVINIIKNQDDFGLYVGVLVVSILENALEFEKSSVLVNREELINFLMENFASICNSSRMKIPVSYDSTTDFMSVVRTILTSKFACRLRKSSILELSTIIVKSFLYSLDDEHMTMGKVIVNVLDGREIFKYYPGFLYQLVDYEDDWICNIVEELDHAKVKILLFTTSLTFNENDNDICGEYDLQIESDLKKRNIFQILEQAIAFDTKVIACQKVVNNEVALFLRRKSVIVIHRMGTELAKQVENASNAFPISDLSQVVSEKVDDLTGVIDALDVIQFGDRRFLQMNNESNMGTLLLQAPSYLSVQLKIVVEQALKTLQKLSSSPFICPGASCFEISLWIQIQELGRKRFKNMRWEWLLQAFVHASGGKLPLWSDSVYNHAWEDEDSCSCNCGLVSKDMVTKLNANWTYMNSFDCKIDNKCDIETLKIAGESLVDLFHAKCNAINIALETCSNICSIGSVVYRKRL